VSQEECAKLRESVP